MSLSRAEAVARLPEPGFFIGGEWVRNHPETHRTHVEPATGEASGPYVAATAADADHAVGAARAAFPNWRATPPAARRDLLVRLGDAIDAAAEELAAIQSLEMGQPVRAARAGVGLAAEWFRYYAGWADKIEGTVSPVAPGSVLDYVLPEPFGVVVAIIPWNGPIIALALKVAPALAAGNCVVLKPPEQTPFSGLVFARLCERRRSPTGRHQCGARRRRGGGNPVRPSGRRQDHVHRRRHRRHGRRLRRGAPPHSGRPRTGRQVGLAGVRRRRAAGGGQAGGGPRCPTELRAGLLLAHPRVRPAVDLRRRGRPDRRHRPRNHRRRPVRREARAWAPSRARSRARGSSA